MSYKRPRSDASPDSGPWGREPVVQLSVSAALDAAQARADAERARHVDELARLQHLVEVERTRHSIETAKIQRLLDETRSQLHQQQAAAGFSALMNECRQLKEELAAAACAPPPAALQAGGVGGGGKAAGMPPRGKQKQQQRRKQKHKSTQKGKKLGGKK